MKKYIILIIFCLLMYFCYVFTSNSSQYSKKELKNEHILNHTKKKKRGIRRRKKKKLKKNFKKYFKKLKQTIQDTQNKELIATFNQLEENVKNNKNINENIEKLNKIANEKDIQTVKKGIEENEPFFYLILSHQNKTTEIEQSEKINNSKNLLEKATIPKESIILSKKENIKLQSIGKEIQKLLKNTALRNYIQSTNLEKLIQSNQKIPKSIIAQVHPDQLKKNKKEKKVNTKELRNLFININEYNSILDSIENNKKADGIRIEKNDLKPIEYNKPINKKTLNESRSENSGEIIIYQEKKNKELPTTTLIYEPKDLKNQNKNNSKNELDKELLKKNEEKIQTEYTQTIDSINEEIKRKKEQNTQGQKGLEEKKIKQKSENDALKEENERIEKELMEFIPSKISTEKNTKQNNQNRNFLEDTYQKTSEKYTSEKYSINKSKNKNSTRTKKSSLEHKSNTINTEIKKTETEEERLEKIKEAREKKRDLHREESNKEKMERAARRVLRLEEEAIRLEKEYEELELKNALEKSKIPKEGSKDLESNNQIVNEELNIETAKPIPNNIDKQEHILQENKNVLEKINSELLDIKKELNFESMSDEITFKNNTDNNNKDLINKLNLIEKNITQAKKNLDTTKEKLSSKKILKNKQQKNGVESVDFISLQNTLSNENLPRSNGKEKLEKIQKEHAQNMNIINQTFDKKKEELQQGFNEAKKIKQQIEKQEEIEKKQQIQREQLKEAKEQKKLLLEKQYAEEKRLQNLREQAKQLEEEQIKQQLEKDRIEKETEKKLLEERLENNKNKVDKRKIEVKNMKEKQEQALIKKQENAKYQNKNNKRNKNNTLNLKETINRKRTEIQEQKALEEKKRLEKEQIEKQQEYNQIEKEKKSNNTKNQNSIHQSNNTAKHPAYKISNLITTENKKKELDKKIENNLDNTHINLKELEHKKSENTEKPNTQPFKISSKNSLEIINEGMQNLIPQNNTNNRNQKNNIEIEELPNQKNLTNLNYLENHLNNNQIIQVPQNNLPKLPAYTSPNAINNYYHPLTNFKNSKNNLVANTAFKPLANYNTMVLRGVSNILRMAPK